MIKKDDSKKHDQHLFGMFFSDWTFSKDTRVKDSCMQIIEFMVEAEVDAESTLLFEEIRRHVSKSIPDQDFVDSVFYLARKDVGYLEQKFSVYSRIDGRPVEVEDEVICRMLEAEEYYNPFSGEDWSRDDFDENVMIYFTPSNNFLFFKILGIIK